MYPRTKIIEKIDKTLAKVLTAVEKARSTGQSHDAEFLRRAVDVLEVEKTVTEIGGDHARNKSCMLQVGAFTFGRGPEGLRKKEIRRVVKRRDREPLYLNRVEGMAKTLTGRSPGLTVARLIVSVDNPLPDTVRTLTDPKLDSAWLFEIEEGQEANHLVALPGGRFNPDGETLLMDPSKPTKVTSRYPSNIANMGFKLKDDVGTEIRWLGLGFFHDENDE